MNCNLEVNANFKEESCDPIGNGKTAWRLRTFYLVFISSLLMYLPVSFDVLYYAWKSMKESNGSFGK